MGDFIFFENNTIFAFCRSQEDYISLSFDTISSSGPNAAINHYKYVSVYYLYIDCTIDQESLRKSESYIQ